MESTTASVYKPPTLDGTNYSVWKVKMRNYIKSIDERAWRAVLLRWTSPMEIGLGGDYVPKDELTWTNDELTVANYNSKALHAITSAVDITMFKLIQNFTAAKDAWDALQSHCEGNISVKQTKLRLLTTRFENLRMGEDLRT